MELPGAADLHAWRAAWNVFQSATVMCGVACGATLDRYAARFEQRCRDFPTAWRLCVQADTLCRFEYGNDLAVGTRSSVHTRYDPTTKM